MLSAILCAFAHMTLQDLQEKLRDLIKSSAHEMFGVELDQINADQPPKPELGDLAFPVSFELAKLVKQKTGEKKTHAPSPNNSKRGSKLSTKSHASRSPALDTSTSSSIVPNCSV